MNRTFILSLLLGGISAAAVAQGPVDAGRFTRVANDLCALPHRLSGTAEGKAAGDRIVKGLNDAGIPGEWIIEQPFEVTQLRLNAGDCWLEADGKRLALQPLRPNGMALPVTPPEGLEAETVYLGNGSEDAFRGRTLQDRIAVLDFKCGDRWQDAVRAGAAAILFVGMPPGAESPVNTYDAPKSVYANFELPRFFVSYEVAKASGALSGGRVRLFCRMGFQRVFGRNLFVMLPARSGALATNEYVMLACHYDTFGTIPFATRNPERAVNAAGLIEVAAAIRKDPLERATVVAFFDNEAQQQAGQIQFHFARDAYSIEDTPRSLLRMINDRTAERAILESKLAVIRDPAAILARQSATPGAGLARQELLAAAELRYNRSVTELSEARREFNLLDRQVSRVKQRIALHKDKADTVTPEIAAAERERLQDELSKAEENRTLHSGPAQARIQGALQTKENLYATRKLLVAGKEPDPDTDGSTRLVFKALLAGVEAHWQSRLAEQEVETEHLRRYQTLGERFAGKDMVALVVWNIHPSPRRWTILGPELVTESIQNLQATRWIKTFFETNSASFPDCNGPGSGLNSPSAAGIGGQVSFVLELGSIGAAFPTPLPPAEPTLDLPSFASHTAEALAFCREFARQPELSRVRIPGRLDAAMIFNVPRWSDSSARYDGGFVRHYEAKSKAGAPIPDAPVFIQRNSRETITADGLPPPDAWGGFWVSSSRAGSFPLMAVRSKNKKLNIQAALYDDQGRITAISQRHPNGLIGMAGNWEQPSAFLEDINNQIVLFEVFSRIRLAGIRSATGPVEEKRVGFIDANTASKPKRLNLSLSGDLLSVFTGQLRGYLVIQGSQLLLNASPYEPNGIGYEPEQRTGNALGRSGRDVWLLDESRLNNLRRHGILENGLERLHARAEQLLDAAVQTADSPLLSNARHLVSLAYSQRVYEPVRTVTNDLIKAVIILLMLAIPFSFALERLISGSPNIYRQIAGFALCFTLVFITLYLVHPAFRFTSFPLVVLLAFIIIILSSTVIVIMWSKFEYEVRKLHGVATASHQSTRTAHGTIVAAITLGIATMRRRPLRTTLTAITILLLTFTILFFGSFKSEDGIRLVLAGPGPALSQVEISSAPGKSFDAQSVASLRMLFADAGTNYIRSWTTATEEHVLAGRLPDDSVFAVNGAATLPPPDLNLYPQLKRALSGDINGFARDGGILLPAPLFEKIPEALRKPAADGTLPQVDFEGQRYVLRGSFEPAGLKALHTLDGASFVPPDLAAVKRQLEVQYPRDPDAVKLKLDEMDLADLPLIAPESVVLIWDPRTRQAPLPAQSLVFLPGTEALARTIAAESSILLDRRASLSAGGEHYRVLYTTQLSLGGFSKVVVPLILGGLIIFGTMLSSVADRQKEIFTFSALGLGPRHVAALFFAEASVYAVVGGMGGYLFAHAFSKVVELMARLGWTEMPAMNHSSMNAMITLLIVMATVLISTIYPAIKASRSANPGAQRTWRMPEPEGDTFDIEFPFTVSDYDAIGLTSFLEEHLLSHRDKSIGLFAADQVEVRHTGGRFIIEASVWLQPFDQGVSQRFILRTEPGAIPGIDRVRVEMTRLSGSPTIWRRSAKVFIHDLRNQFILWRTIPDDAAEHYYQMTTARFTVEKGTDA